MNKKPVEILLVEDRPEDAELTMFALNENKLANNIKWVEDGEEAINFLFCKEEYSERSIHETPKLVLLDLKLPKLNGIEVLKEVKNDTNLKKIPIVMLTTSKEDSDLQEAYKFGVNSYIVKPVDFEKFIHAVRDIGMYWLLLNETP